MLVLTRKPGEKLLVGDDITVTLLDIRGRQVRLGIEAPGHRRIVRAELLDTDQHAEQPENGARYRLLAH
jgi:carbon storage regulator